MLENSSLTILKMQDILPNRFQPRIQFDEIKLNGLAESIRKYGVIQPIVVRQIGNKYEIVAGERRYKASFLANKETIPAIVVNLTDRQSEEIALLENIQRQDLTSIEEAVSYKRILDIGYITQEELSKKLGMSQSAVASKIRLLNLDDSVQDALLHGKISERHARSLLRLHNKNKESYMLNRIITERLTVKRTDEEINKLLNSTEQKSVFEEEIQNKNSNVATPRESHKLGSSNEPEKKINKIERSQNFMDIDKILQEAQDINTTPTTKTQADMTQLMQQNPSTTTFETAQNTTTNSEAIPVPNNNKFINLNGVQNTTTQPNSLNTAPTTNQTAEGVSFDSIFNQQPLETKTTAPTENTIPQNSTPTNTTVEPLINVAPTQTVPEIEPLSVQNTEPNVPDISVVEATAPMPPSIPEVNTISPLPLQPNIPATDLQNNNQTSQTAVPSNDAHRLMQAINLARKCATEIENLGFTIDVDEVNLDNIYQFTFKINKN